MTTTFIDVTGKTEDEAVSAALAQLGMDRDQVSVEVLERAKKGFLGIGASPAKVRVTYAVETPAPDRKPEPPAPRPAAAAAPASAPPREERPRREHPDRSERRRSDRPRPEPAPRAAAQEEEALPALQPVDLGELCTDERAQKITAFLTGLLQHMGSGAQVKVYQPEEGRYKVILEGEKLGQLIGRRGETLDAIQQLTSYSVNRGQTKRVRIHLDAEGYRAKREESLTRLARKVAGKVVKYRKNVTLEAMNAYERHVIHTALQDYPDVTTYSVGTEPNRHTVVAYSRGEHR